MNLIKALRRRVWLIRIKVQYYSLTRIYGMDIDKTARIAYGARMDKTYGQGLHIGAESCVAGGAIIYTHDFCRNIHLDTYIGKRCFIGANAIIMPGVKIGDECVIGAGSIVTKDIPSNCMAVGNPARIIKDNIRTKKFGQLIT